ncbi:MAG: ribonuclease P protein component [Erysipelotrichaceae bacterium]|nr:ribonuclease P protein component [Erysipelotrichaceae bacterium]
MKKKFRVKRSEQFQKIIKTGEHKANGSFVLYRTAALEDHDRVGISVGKKLGNAVERNKVKRQVRMMIDDIFSFKDQRDVIVIVRKGYQDVNFANNKMKLKSLYDAFIKKKETN